MSKNSPTDAVAEEQAYVTGLYNRLDRLRDRAAGNLGGSLRQDTGTRQALVERDDAVARDSGALARLDAVENGLCFGRLDRQDGSSHHVGLLGILDAEDDYNPLLIDWRAPAARPFYTATAVHPEGIARRRHIRTRLRTVTRVDDDVLDLDSDGELTGEAVLLSALNAQRTGTMPDIVRTIQSEQDDIIRAPLPGVMVVQGGPGTGKTAVALHRAAYLLYTHREILEKRGILILGPNTAFLRYIGEVLPALGETSALLATVGDLFPGITPTGAETDAVAEVKGRATMAAALEKAVRDRQEIPTESLRVPTGYGTLDLEPSVCAAARDKARASGLPHNTARAYFVAAVLDSLAAQAAEKIGKDDVFGGSFLDEVETADIRRELGDYWDVKETVSGLWPVLTPLRLLRELFVSPERLASAGLPEILLRPEDSAWTAADVPLLDEAVELLDAVRDFEDEPEMSDEDKAYAQGVLDILAGSMDFEHEDDSEMLSAGDLLDAEVFAGRHEHSEYRTVAQRAIVDRTWTFGHVIVDEAQELSAMAWRLVMRRCPVRSMTVVGDIDQTGTEAGAESWAQVLEPYVQDRWRLAELTVNYRTPAEIMAVANDVVEGSVSRSVRSTGVEPWARRAAPSTYADIIAAEAARDGLLGVIVPPSLAGLTGALTVREAKGLEFDSVLVIDPAAIMSESVRGRNDLYVALTRATQRLGVVYPDALPAVLSRLA